MTTRFHRSAVLLALVLGALLAAGCGGGGGSSKAASSNGAAAASAKVRIASFKYVPQTIEVKRGGTVTWTNEDSAKHTATDSAANGFDTGTLEQGQSKRVTFKKAGTFNYTCDFHPFMKGTVVVK